MFPFERGFTDPVLLHVVIGAEANHPSVGGLERRAAVGAAAHVSTFAGVVGAAGHRAGVATHPGAVRGAGTLR
ncbi:hypothetical protein G7077_09505 [Sphingomonas piscis]|uniref:Uncharacterized protein n=1 Tax=Sphingomonas piscis TaxID=2714943 RepID=A0A6G7YQT4_9SPHN|nr:hypothetical protein [Sphingomonas piscis]QIK79096.1 hypothetical protein G7077_09505 [Sphingomonas piscis]